MTTSSSRRSLHVLALAAAIICAACTDSCDDDSGPTGPTPPRETDRPNVISDPTDRTILADCDVDDVQVVDWRHFRQFGQVTWDARVSGPSDCTFTIFFKIQVKQGGSVVGRRELQSLAGGSASTDDYWVCGGVRNAGCHVAELPDENGAYRIAYRSLVCRSGACTSGDLSWPD